MSQKTGPQPLQIEFDGETYEFDELGLDVDEAETIQKYVGRSLGDWSNGVAACEIKSVMALWWLLRKQGGYPARSIASQPPPGFKPLRLWKAWNDAALAELQRQVAEKAAAEKAAAEEAEQEAGPDPTRPAPSSPAPAGTPTTTGSAAAAALLSPPG